MVLSVRGLVRSRFRRLLTVVLFAPLLPVTVASCRGREQTPAASEGERQVAGRIAILKWVTHPALDDLETGVLEILESERRVPEELRIEQFNANGSPEQAKQMAELCTLPDVDVAIAIATPAAQAIARTPAPSGTPLVYGAVADPKGAGVLDRGHVTGIQNVGEGIVHDALAFMRAGFPAAKRIGTIYNPSEQNSVFVQGLIVKLAPAYGFEVAQVAVEDASKVAMMAEAVARTTDLIYSANDNTVNSAAGSVAAVALALKKPFIIGDLSTLKAVPLLQLASTTARWGKEVGKIALRVLAGESIDSIHPMEPPSPQVWISRNISASLDVQLPQEAQALVTRDLD